LGRLPGLRTLPCTYSCGFNGRRDGNLSDVEGNPAEEQVKHLQVALEHRTRIGIAIGMLMVRLDIDEDTALAYLRRQSQHDNRKVYDLAADVIAGAQPHVPPDGPEPGAGSFGSGPPKTARRRVTSS
jgi:hypothetical protein